jgi:diacylglycerol kinase
MQCGIKEYHPVIKQVKNVAAGIVLVASGIACSIGSLFYSPINIGVSNT